MSAVRRVPVLLLAGFPGPALESVANRLARQGPPGERLALLDIGCGCELAGAERFVVLGGCACCAAQLAFHTTLVRLLRQGPWDRVLLVASAQGHPWQLYERLIDLAPRFALAPAPAGVAIDAGSLAPFLVSEHPAHPSAKTLLQMARWVALHTAGVDPEGPVADQAQEALQRALRAASPWPGVVCRPEGPAQPVWPPGLSALSAHAGARLWRWPATRIFDRSRIERLLRRQCGRRGRARSLLALQAIFRTARGWYHWRWQADPGGGGRLVCEETGWRNDSRLQFGLPGPNWVPEGRGTPKLNPGATGCR